MSQRPSPIAAIRRIVSLALFRIKQVTVRVVQLVQRDELRVLRLETRRLGSASVESATYIGTELRAMDQRLARLEEDVAAMRRLLEERNAAAPERVEAITGPSDSD